MRDMSWLYLINRNLAGSDCNSGFAFLRYRLAESSGNGPVPLFSLLLFTAGILFPRVYLSTLALFGFRGCDHPDNNL